MLKLSIIIVTYNSEKLIKPCLDSIFKTITGLDFEIIIIDNNSQDQTVSLIEKKFPQVHLIQNKENVGFAQAVNQGIRKAQGNFILLLNPDMRVLDRAVNKSLEFLIKNSQVGILGCQLLYPDGKIQTSFGRFPSLLTEFLQATFLYKVLPFGRFIPYNFLTRRRFKKTHQVDWLGGGFMMIKKEVIEKIGFLDENYFLYLEDIDFCFRAKKAGFKIYYFPEAKVIHYHMVSTQKDPSQAIINEAKSLLYYFKKYNKNIVLLKFLIRLRLNLGVLGYFLLKLFNKRFKELFEVFKKAKKDILIYNHL